MQEFMFSALVDKGALIAFWQPMQCIPGSACVKGGQSLITFSGFHNHYLKHFLTHVVIRNEGVMGVFNPPDNAVFAEFPA